MDTLNKQLSQNKKGKEEKDDGKKKKKEVKLLQLGKGTETVFNEITEKYKIETEEKSKETFDEISSKYFNLNNF